MSLKKAKDYLGNELQVDSAIKDAKGQVIHQTYQDKLTTTAVNDGAISKNIGFDSSGNIVKATPASGGMTNPMTTAGDIIVGGTSGAPERLAKGTAGQVLTMNSGATAPEWQTPSGGGGLTCYQLDLYGSAIGAAYTIANIQYLYIDNGAIKFGEGYVDTLDNINHITIENCLAFKINGISQQNGDPNNSATGNAILLSSGLTVSGDLTPNIWHILLGNYTMEFNTVD